MDKPATANHKLRPNPASFFLPDDILIGIFARLPVRSLLRFRCVSKSWHHLISSDYKHLLPSPMCGLFHNDWGTIKFTSLKSRTYIDPLTIDVSLSFLPSSLLHSPDLCVHDSCNGLLLLRCDAALYVCNPATQQWAKIPEEPTDPQNISGRLHLIADPRHSPNYNIYGFSYHDVFLTLLEFHVFSSTTGRWSTSRSLGWLECPFFHPGLAFLNGRVYVLDKQSQYVLEINAESKFCRRICGPMDVGQIRHLGHCRGLLHVAAVIPGQEFFVWALEDEKSDCFVLKKRISCEHLLAPVAFHPDLDVIFLRAGRRQLFAFDFLHGKLEKMGEEDVYGSNFVYSPCYSRALDGM